MAKIVWGGGNGYGGEMTRHLEADYVRYYVLHIPCCSMNEVTLNCQHDGMGFMHFDPF